MINLKPKSVGKQVYRFIQYNAIYLTFRNIQTVLYIIYGHKYKTSLDWNDTYYCQDNEYLKEGKE